MKEMPLSVEQLWEAMCDAIMHEMSFKAALRELNPTREELQPFLRVLNTCRRSRKKYGYTFEQYPEGLVFGWSKWHSGGGCWIWQADLPEGWSVHVTEECAVLCDISCKKHYELEWDSLDPNEDTQEKHEKVICDQNDIAQGRDVDYLFVQYVGQETADAIKRDIDLLTPYM